MGGVVKAVEEGYPQREIARSAYEFQRQVDAGERAIVGVNKYVQDGEGDGIPTLKIALEVEKRQIEEIRAVRAQRDDAAAQAALAAVRDAVRDDGVNLMPPIIDAVKAEVTLGEICDIFRAEWGEHRDPAYL
jgi:methylmalonyl-CoA mutase N-terminal domain/subunit